MQQINLKNLDKSNWKSYRFDQIAKNISERVDPNNTDLKIYVGLEHIDSENLHINRTGTPDDVNGTKLRCYPGDIIFGRRRAYQRKAAIAEFDGFCSAHSLVLRANPKVIDPRLFPFFMHSDLFMHLAVDISVGSLSPTINWGTLKSQEFLLPPKDQQAQLAELLWAMDDVIESEVKVLEKLDKSYSTVVDNLFSKPLIDWKYIPLKNIASINHRSLKSDTVADYEFKYLDIAGIVEPKVIGELIKLKFGNSPSRARRIVENNSIVLSMVRPYQKSFVFVENAEDMIASTGTGVIKVKEGVNAKFVFHQFFSKRFITYCENRMTGTNYPAITSSDIEQFKIGIPKDSNIMNMEAERMEQIDKSILALKSEIASSKALQKSLINQIF